ncbi:hypothetical protein HDU76_009950, partial [Blyttiomyces sp. JEL0837]
MKSLTTEDLEMSTKKGYWATQHKNEPILNRAFKNSINVYLIFSANRSGEFFGLARMESATETFANEHVSNYDWMPTPSHESDDGFDGIGGSGGLERSSPSLLSAAVGNASASRDSKWGRPFKVRWISVKRVNFSLVKHLKNSWNANKPLHVARDATENYDVNDLTPSSYKQRLNLPPADVLSSYFARKLERFQNTPSRPPIF